MNSFCLDASGLSRGHWGLRVHLYILKIPALHDKILLSFKFMSLATDPKNHTVMFDTLEDWSWELERTKGSVNYKAVKVNEGYKVCER